MKTISNNFTHLQNLPGAKIVTRIYFKRRYWDTVNTTYTYESAWTELNQADFASISNIAQQLDTKNLSEFKVSNVSIKVKNEGNQWDEGNSTGKFGADAGSSFGYEPYLTKFKVEAGYLDPGGSEERLTLFIGVAVDFNFDGKSRMCSITVEGLQRRLIDAEAENVSTLVTSEQIGTGDGVTKEFYTDNNGIAKINSVVVNVTTMTKGTDYEISGLGDLDAPVKITLAKPVEDQIAVYCTYRYWKKNQTVEQLISDLVAEAGITSTSISNATLGSISNNITLSSKDEFEDGTNTLMNTTTNKDGTMTPNMIVPTSFGGNFASGTVADNGWTALFTGDAKYWSVTGGKLNVNSSGDTQAGALKKTYGYNVSFGSWEWKMKSAAAGAVHKIWFMANGDTQDAHNGYFIKTGGAGVVLDSIKFGYNTVDTTTENILFYISVGGQFTTETTIRIDRDIEGTFKIYVNNTFKFSVQDTTYAYGDRFILASAASNLDYDDFGIPASAVSAIHVSKTIDTIGGITAWGNLSVDYELGQLDSITFETRVSDDGSSWDAYVASSASGPINSAVKRYIQVRITVTADTAFLQTLVNPYLPQLSSTSEESTGALRPTKIFSYTVQFTSDRVLIAMGNFQGMNCYQAIQELAKLSDFVWGIDDNETFFFRARNTSSSVDLTLTEATNLSTVDYMKKDYSKFYAGVRVKFGSFLAESVASADARTSALEIIGNRKLLEISGQSLVNKDTNVSDSIASIYKTRLGGKKKYLRVSTKFLPQVELGDTVSVTLKHDPDDGYHFLNALICNVVGVNQSPMGARSGFDLEEII